MEEIEFTFSDKVKGVAGAIADTAVRAATGQPILASADEAEARMQICISCDYFQPEGEKCSICNCPMRIKTKLGGGYCPLKKH